MRIEYTAEADVLRVANSIGRTEDVKFSPSGDRLAVAAFKQDKIFIFSLSFTEGNTKQISLTDVVDLSVPSLNCPHGVDFLDNDSVIVANREGGVVLIKVRWPDDKQHEAVPVLAIDSGDLLKSPGSVAVKRRSESLYDILVCDNYANCVTRHTIYANGNDYEVTSNEMCLTKHLLLPDGVCFSQDDQWVAISNHGTHCVFVYRNDESLGVDSEPCSILRCVYSPHGLSFTPDSQYLLVADAATPFIHIYRRPGTRWQGILNPIVSFRAVSVPNFLRGKSGGAEGGVKGLHINSSMSFLVTTHECETLAFFDLRAMLERLPLLGPDGEWLVDPCEFESLTGWLGDGYCHDQNTLELNYELNIQRLLIESRLGTTAAKVENS